MADVDTPMRQELLDVTKAEAEAEIKPDGVADDVRRKPVALERNRPNEMSCPTAAYATNTGDLLSFA
ncbi:hypothetical protein [Brevundimonas subvibrioides]|uniref:hypothetical protein n=1 Tax=Brevundimonas subvibrioides TaxID=74313 RepID=UPI0022B512EE|nr:hypothetical protein [Brevundimonas subvibrioides]